MTTFDNFDEVLEAANRCIRLQIKAAEASAAGDAELAKAYLNLNSTEWAEAILAINLAYAADTPVELRERFFGEVYMPCMEDVGNIHLFLTAMDVLYRLAERTYPEAPMVK